MKLLKDERKLKDPSLKKNKRARDGDDVPSSAAQEEYDATSVLRGPFKLSQAQQDRGDRKYRELPLPPGSIRRAIRPLAHLGSMNINDIQRFIRTNGPGGYHLAATDLPDEQLQTLIDFMDCVHLLTRPEVDLVHMATIRIDWLEKMARVERDVPGPEGKAMVNHGLIEIWQAVLEWGPLWTHWTYIFERFLASLTRKMTNRAAPERSMCDNWCMSASLDLMRTQLRGQLDGVLSGGLPGCSKSRVHAKIQSLGGLNGARARATKHGPATRSFPKFRATSRGHSLLCLSQSDRSDVAALLGLQPDQVQQRAERFDCKCFVGGVARTTGAMDAATVAAGKFGCSSVFAVAAGRAGQEVIGKIKTFVRVFAAGDVTADLVVAAFFLPMVNPPRSFGYQCVDNRTISAPKFVLRGDVGAPVGCVRSPRLGDPPHVSWVIDTHWSDKRWKRELQN